MSTKQFAILVVFVSVFSLIGGVVGSYLLSSTDAYAAADHKKVFIANNYKLVDDTGTVRAVFGLTKNEPSIVFYNHDNTTSVIMGIQPNGNPGMTILGESRIIMGN